MRPTQERQFYFLVLLRFLLTDLAFNVEFSGGFLRGVYARSTKVSTPKFVDRASRAFVSVASIYFSTSWRSSMKKLSIEAAGGVPVRSDRGPEDLAHRQLQAVRVHCDGARRAAR